MNKIENCYILFCIFNDKNYNCFLNLLKIKNLINRIYDFDRKVSLYIN